jgi:hypothetical protein
MTPPSGNPDDLLAYARQLDSAAKGTTSLSTSTQQTMSSIKTNAAWAGAGATASMALSIGPQLTKIATAIRDYAPALANAQDKVGAYNLYVADEAMAGGNDPGYSTAMQNAALDAESAMQTWQTAAARAASAISGSATGLANVFPAGGKVRSSLASLPAGTDPFTAQPAPVGPDGTPILGTTLAGNLGPQSFVNTPTADPVPGIVIDGPTAGLGPGTILMTPQDLSGLAVNKLWVDDDGYIHYGPDDGPDPGEPDPEGGSPGKGSPDPPGEGYITWGGDSDDAARSDGDYDPNDPNNFYPEDENSSDP